MTLEGYRPEDVIATPLQSIRKHCLTCCGGCPGGVRKCELRDCWLWPYRLGKRPARSERSQPLVHRGHLRREHPG